MRFVSAALYGGVYGILAALAASVGCGGLDAPVQLKPVTEVGTRANAWTLDGRPCDPLAESPDEVVVLVFVRTDCPISNRYAPTLRRLNETYSPQGVAFYLVYPNPNLAADEIRSHLEEYDYSMVALQDKQHALVELTGAIVTPEAAVFNREGKLVYHGRIDNWYVDFGKARPSPTTHDLREAIEAALRHEELSKLATEAVGCYIADLK